MRNINKEPAAKVWRPQNICATLWKSIWLGFQDFCNLCGQEEQQEQESGYNFRQRDERRCITGEERRDKIFKRIILWTNKNIFKQLFKSFFSKAGATMHCSSSREDSLICAQGRTRPKATDIQVFLHKKLLTRYFVTFPATESSVFQLYWIWGKVNISSAPDPWNSLFIKAPIEKYIPTFPISPSRSMSLFCLILPPIFGKAQTIPVPTHIRCYAFPIVVWVPLTCGIKKSCGYLAL